MTKSENRNKRVKDNVSLEFSSMLREKLGNQLVQTTLYGSRARADSTFISDYDFLIIVKKKSSEQKNIIYDLCFTMPDQYNSLISFLLYDEQEWQRKKRFPLGLNILKEGVQV